MYLPDASAATVPSSSTISPVPSNSRFESFVIRPMTRISRSSGHGLAEPHGELDGDAPRVGLADGDGAADRLVERGRRDAAVHAARVALVVLGRLEHAEELPALELEEARVQPAAFSTPHTMHMRLTFCAPVTLRSPMLAAPSLRPRP